LKDENSATIRTAIDELNQVWSAASQQMYNQQSATPPTDGEAPPQDATQPPPTDTVEEAEYTVVEEDEKK